MNFVPHASGYLGGDYYRSAALTASILFFITTIVWIRNGLSLTFKGGRPGQHESEHTSHFTSYWTTENVRNIADKENFKLDFYFRVGTKEETIKAKLSNQLNHIGNFLIAYGNWLGDKKPDGVRKPPPKFKGARR